MVDEGVDGASLMVMVLPMMLSDGACDGNDRMVDDDGDGGSRMVLTTMRHRLMRWMTAGQ